MKKTKGFTLIELLVVISIIGVLSSVVLASLNSARQKAKEAAIKSSVRQLERIMQLEYDETGTYATVQNPINWVPQYLSCDQLFVNMINSTRQSQARALCKTIVANGPVGFWGSPGHNFLIGNTLDNSQKFSIMALLNANTATFFCSGSGGTSDNAQYWAASNGGDVSNTANYPLTPAGCYYNP